MFYYVFYSTIPYSLEKCEGGEEQKEENTIKNTTILLLPKEDS